MLVIVVKVWAGNLSKKKHEITIRKLVPNENIRLSSFQLLEMRHEFKTNQK